MSTVQQPNPNYVVSVAWMVEGTDGTYSARNGSNTTFDPQQESSFVPYDQLTEEMVIGWVQANLGEQGVADYESQIQSQINAISNPPDTPQSQPLPWAGA